MRFRGTSPAQYWSSHTVVGRKEFTSREESLLHRRWRGSQYFFYDELMPVAGFDNQVILDYGCGPGNDVVGFIEYSNPRKIVGMDISPLALNIGKKRLGFHESKCVEFQQINENDSCLPFEDETFDYIHCVGVLHHMTDCDENRILREFHRILKSDGKIRILQYNYHSIWVHLYIAYNILILNRKKNGNLTLEDAFRRSTDGPDCPISRYYTKQQFMQICTDAGFYSKFLGSAISLHEMKILPSRFDAIENYDLPEHHRDFLFSLTFDRYSRPLYESDVAGIDGCYELKKEK